MKWFIKCLKQYADFSGRARRTEYWMFVLFNIIFSVVWLFLLTLLFVAFNIDSSEEELTGAMTVANLIFGVSFMLPGMAVAVRRLHDVGKSGWWLLVALTGIGAFWLLAWMLIEGQEGENKYGTNPKTSPETLSESAKLRSAGVTLIVATVFAMLITVIDLLSERQGFSLNNYITAIVHLIAHILLFSAGIFLLNEKHIYIIVGKMKKAIILLLAAVSIIVILKTMGIIRQINFMLYIYNSNDTVLYAMGEDYYKEDMVEFFFNYIKILITNSLSFVSCLLLALLTISILFAAQNKNLIRTVAVCTMVFSGLALFSYTYINLGNADMYTDNFQKLGWDLMIYTYNVLFAISFIVLAGAFLTKKEALQPVVSNVSNRVYQKMPNIRVNTVSNPKIMQTSILDQYRNGLAYLDACGIFDETKFRAFNRITGNRFSDADIENQLRNAQLMIRGMEDLKATLRSTMIEAIRVFEEVERQGIDLSKYNM